MFVIKEVDLNDIIDFRHEILRPYQSIEDCIYDTDKHMETFHVGAYHGEELVSIASFNRECTDFFCEADQFRLRAMATKPDFRKQGAGRLIVQFAEKKLILKGCGLLWCKGRTSVIEYYNKLGFEPFGDVFDYPPIGPHIILFKRTIPIAHL
ncbi:MAG: GNAT family N-acetyltransferase [Bacillota bacterium]|nr:GNAT family N-acetyltransferase [Bacillota bacterium]